jgi:hypothetical protein
VQSTALADYLNLHPEILVCQLRSKTTQQGEIQGYLSTFERLLDSGPKESGDSAPDNDGDDLIVHNAELLANKDLAKLRWIGDRDVDYTKHMESVAANNPGARFIVMYRAIEEIAESWETKDVHDSQKSNNGFEQAIKTWNRSLQGTRRFMRDSVVPQGY